MGDRVDTAGVLGAGVMGSAIAAHLAGAGIRTHLLDMVPPDLSGDARKDSRARNRFAESGLAKTLKAKPAAFYDPDAARLIVPGNFEDHFDRLRECDLVIEAVVERLEVKKELFAKVVAATRPETILASNTSGLSIARIGEDLPAEAQRRLVVMHFFNPVRYMRLLEIVPGPKTDAAVLKRAVALGEWLGKGIVYGKDTPNFVANRIGIYGLMQVMRVMEEDGYTIEEVDKIVGEPMGRPRTAAFRTADLVGIDTLVHVARNCYDSLPDDEERSIFSIPKWLDQLVQSGRLGQKSGAGFYKKQGDEILVLDLKTLDYRPQHKVRYDSLGVAKNVEDVGERLKGLVAADDRAGQFAWKVLSRSLAYTARRVGEIADDIVNIDRAMRWGFNWSQGPFEGWDAVGVPESLARMRQDGLALPAWVVDMVERGRKSFYQGEPGQRSYYDMGAHKSEAVPRDARHIELAALHVQGKVIRENMGASLMDLGDGCLCFEVHTKMNTVDDDVIGLLGEAVDEAERNFAALVIGNDGEHFGAGANLMLIYMASQEKQWEQIGNMVRAFQASLQRVRYAKVPVVAAPFQYTLGGGAEIAMAACACQAHAETYMGLVEAGVGLVPAGCGCLRMVERFTGDTDVTGVDLLPLVGQASLQIATAKVATGAEEARRLRYLRRTDGITLNRDHLLAHAKARALGLAAAGYRAPRPQLVPAAGFDAAKTIAVRAWSMVEAGYASAHDALIAKKVAHVLCGGEVAAGTLVPEQHILDLEREAFLSLCGEELSQARMQSMLMTGKPLRN